MNNHKLHIPSLLLLLSTIFAVPLKQNVLYVLLNSYWNYSDPLVDQTNGSSDTFIHKVSEHVKGAYNMTHHLKLNFDDQLRDAMNASDGRESNYCDTLVKRMRCLSDTIIDKFSHHFEGALDMEDNLKRHFHDQSRDTMNESDDLECIFCQSVRLMNCSSDSFTH